MRYESLSWNHLNKYSASDFCFCSMRIVKVTKIICRKILFAEAKCQICLRDKEGNIWREGSFGKKLSRQKSQANSWRHYTQFIQGALFQTTLFTSKPKYGKMLE